MFYKITAITTALALAIILVWGYSNMPVEKIAVKEIAGKEAKAKIEKKRVIIEDSNAPYNPQEDYTADIALAKNYSKNIRINPSKYEFVITPDSGDIEIVIKNHPSDACATVFQLTEIIDNRYAMFEGAGECDNGDSVFIDLRSGYYVHGGSAIASPNKKRIVTVARGNEIEIFEPSEDNKLYAENFYSITATDNPDYNTEFFSWKSDDELVLKFGPEDPENPQDINLSILDSTALYKTFIFNSKLKKWEEKTTSKNAPRK